MDISKQALKIINEHLKYSRGRQGKECFVNAKQNAIYTVELLIKNVSLENQLYWIEVLENIKNR